MIFDQIGLQPNCKLLANHIQKFIPFCSAMISYDSCEDWILVK